MEIRPYDLFIRFLVLVTHDHNLLKRGNEFLICGHRLYISPIIHVRGSVVGYAKLKLKLQ